jgi:hypothetical protein
MLFVSARISTSSNATLRVTNFSQLSNSSGVQVAASTAGHYYVGMQYSIMHEERSPRTEVLQGSTDGTTGRQFDVSLHVLAGIFRRWSFVRGH